ncbi:MAG: hypothetical protein WEB52_02290 [Dehalococcoidia bacterium]
MSTKMNSRGRLFSTLRVAWLRALCVVVFGRSLVSAASKYGATEEMPSA